MRPLLHLVTRVALVLIGVAYGMQVALADDDDARPSEPPCALDDWMCRDRLRDLPPLTALRKDDVLFLRITEMGCFPTAPFFITLRGDVTSIEASDEPHVGYVDLEQYRLKGRRRVPQNDLYMTDAILQELFKRSISERRLHGLRERRPAVLPRR